MPDSVYVCVRVCLCVYVHIPQPEVKVVISCRFRRVAKVATCANTHIFLCMLGVCGTTLASNSAVLQYKPVEAVRMVV